MLHLLLFVMDLDQKVLLRINQRLIYVLYLLVLVIFAQINKQQKVVVTEL